MHYIYIYSLKRSKVNLDPIITQEYSKCMCMSFGLRSYKYFGFPLKTSIGSCVLPTVYIWFLSLSLFRLWIFMITAIYCDNPYAISIKRVSFSDLKKIYMASQDIKGSMWRMKGIIH